ncbi:MAG: alpha/beta hydrolase [Candidatus Marinimicrobia bacterium]|nr:alpha/beta hydrolase [Candidatus Neomarinimicrobiota bacterium]
MKQARTIKEMCHMIGLFNRAVLAVLLFSCPGLFNQLIKWRPVLKKKRIGLSGLPAPLLPASLRQAGRQAGKSGKIPATLYTREKVKTRPVFIFVAGVRSYYIKRRQLNTLAKTLAIIGYHVIVVDDTAHTDIKFTKVTPNNMGDLIDAIYQEELFDKERIVLAGSDFSSRFLFSIMNDSERIRKIRCLLFLSPVADIPALVRFAFTGRIKFGDRWIYRNSSASTRLLYLNNILENYINTGRPDKVSVVFRCLLENRTAEAFKIAQNLDPETRNLILSVFRGEMNEEDVRELSNIDNRDLGKMFLPSVSEIDIERPVFIIHSILDEDVDCGQSQDLVKALSSSSGVYLHLTDFITPAGNRLFFSNPARWIKGVFRLAKALCRIFVFIYSYKNYPYNPTKTAIRITD